MSCGRSAFAGQGGLALTAVKVSTAVMPIGVREVTEGRSRTVAAEVRATLTGNPAVMSAGRAMSRLRPRALVLFGLE